jgi:hypothetical protein
MHIELSAETFQIRLAWWQKALGLLGNVTVPRAAISDVEVVEEPLREAMRSGLKVGLRVPWWYYVARTIRLDRLFIVRRGVPALAFAVHGQGALERVLVSTPDAQALAERLRSG